VLLVPSHPVQYNAPIYRLYASDPRLSITVAYCDLGGANKMHDPDFGVEVAWDVPVLEGYPWMALRNWSRRAGADRLFGLVNPELWRTVAEGDFDVVVVYGYRALSFWIATAAARRAGSAVVLAMDAHSLGSTSGGSWKARLKRLLLPRLAGIFDGLLVPSSAGAAFAETLGIPSKRVFLAPYVVDNDFFDQRSRVEDRPAIRDSWGIPPGAPVALFAGKLVPWKRPGDLLKAVADADGLYAVYAGDGALHAELERTAAGLGVAERVRFLGFVNQSGLPAVYRAADVLVLPSEHEPFGLVVNEAFACGVPAIVSSACGSAGDLVREGITGYVVGVGDVTTLAARLRLLAADPQLRQRLGEGARARIADWGPKQNAEGFAGACVCLAAGRSRG
jgi:glycosyltransferase involved in cell wall biosynthesis